jgi:hypothetical protein
VDITIILARGEIIMNTKRLISYVATGLAFFILVGALLAWGSQKDDPANFPEDMPISKFIIGKWKVVSLTDMDNEKKLEIAYPFVNFKNESLVYYSDFRASYTFTEPNVILVDNRRVAGKETWLLERANDNLIIYATVFDKKTKIVLERVSNWTLP